MRELFTSTMSNNSMNDVLETINNSSNFRWTTGSSEFEISKYPTDAQARESPAFEYNVSSLQTASSQHIPTFSFATIFLVINLCLMIPLTYFNSLIVKMAKREQKKNEQTLLCSVLSVYAKLHIFATIYIIINTNFLISFFYPISEVLGKWYCHMVEVTIHICGMYVGTISLLVAVLRYYFIVHYEQSNPFGREKAIARVLIFHISITFFLSITNSLSNGHVDQMFWENQCWGHKTSFHSEGSSVLDIVPNIICYNREYQIKTFFGEQLSSYMEPILRFACGVSTLSCMAALSNLIELVLYLVTLKHMDRWVIYVKPNVFV